MSNIHENIKKIIRNKLKEWLNDELKKLVDAAWGRFLFLNRKEQKNILKFGLIFKISPDKLELFDEKWLNNLSMKFLCDVSDLETDEEKYISTIKYNLRPIQENAYTYNNYKDMTPIDIEHCSKRLLFRCFKEGISLFYFA